MTDLLLLGPVLAPIAAAALLVLMPGDSAGDRAPLLARMVAWGVSASVLLIGGALLATTLHGATPSVRLGGWPAGIAITLVADPFSALMLTVSALLVLVSLTFAAATGEDVAHAFLPLALVLSSGVHGALLTADLFNLFVFVEVMLVPSYVLLVLGGGSGRRAAARLYVMANLMASTVFLAGVGLLYGVTGTVNLADLAGAAGDPPAAAAAAVVLVALAVKAGVVPLHSWLPTAYSATGPAVTVLFSGLLTKVGVYALFRIYAVVFDGDRRYLWLVMAAAVVTMVVGVVCAVGEKAMRPVLAFHMVSQIGYMLLGLALFTTAGLTAAIFFLVQYVLVKAALLICAGAVETGGGTGRLDQVGGLMRREPLLALAFAVSALALVGIPPLSGFVAKLGLATAAVAGDRYVAALAIAAVSLVTLISMLKLWNAVFWEDVEPADSPSTRGTAVAAPPRLGLGLVAPALLLAASVIVLGVWAEPLLVAAEAAAAGLMDTTTYVTAVTGR